MKSFETLLSALTYDSVSGNFYWKPRAVNTHRDKAWNTKYTSQPAGNINPQGYRVINKRDETGKTKLYQAHRLAWIFHYREVPQEEIDHINMDKTDNRICNLRLASKAENSQNKQKPSKRNKTGFLGVSFHQGKYAAHIVKDKKQYYLGSYSTPEEAYEKYTEAKRVLHPFGEL